MIKTEIVHETDEYQVVREWEPGVWESLRLEWKPGHEPEPEPTVDVAALVQVLAEAPELTDETRARLIDALGGP